MAAWPHGAGHCHPPRGPNLPSADGDTRLGSPAGTAAGGRSATAAWRWPGSLASRGPGSGWRADSPPAILR